MQPRLIFTSSPRSHPIPALTRGVRRGLGGEIGLGVSRKTVDDIGDGTLIAFSDAITVGFGGRAVVLAISVFVVSTGPASAVATDPFLFAAVGATFSSPADDADTSVLELTGAIAALAGAAMAASLVSSPFTHGSTTSSRPTASSAQPGGMRRDMT